MLFFSVGTWLPLPNWLKLLNYFAAFCDFEDTQMCGYTQSLSDQFDWTLKSGHTAPTGTGPAYDHTYTTAQGRLIYMLQEALKKLLVFCSEGSVLLLYKNTLLLL